MLTELHLDWSEECCLADVNSCNAVTLMQLHLDLSEGRCLPEVTRNADITLKNNRPNGYELIKNRLVIDHTDYPHSGKSLS